MRSPLLGARLGNSTNPNRSQREQPSELPSLLPAGTERRLTDQLTAYTGIVHSGFPMKKLAIGLYVALTVALMVWLFHQADRRCF